MARSPLRDSRCSKDEILLRVRVLDPVSVGKPEICGCCHRQLPRRRHQYVQMTLIRCNIHAFSSLGERLSPDALASDDPQKASQCSNRILPPCGLPIFGDLPLPFRSGAPFEWPSRLRFSRVPDAKLCKALQVRFHPKCYLRVTDALCSGKPSVGYWRSRHFRGAFRLRSVLLTLLPSQLASTSPPYWRSGRPPSW